MNFNLTAAVIFSVAGLGILLCFCGKQRGNTSGVNRSKYEKEIASLTQKMQGNKTHKKLQVTYAKKLFEIGDFSRSSEIIKPLLADANPPVNATYLAAYNSYLHGKYFDAENIFRKIVESDAPFKMKINAQIGLVGTAYQTNNYSKAHDIFKGLEGKISLAIWEMMRGFGDEKPYRIDWKVEDKTVVPFVTTDPLPVISLEVNGKQVYVFIDTGAELLYLDESFSDLPGIKTITKQIEPYAGGKCVEVSYARADNVKINNIMIKSIPVKLGPIQRFSKIFPNIKISGILSTGILQQFLPTIDYQENRLVLRRRNKNSRLNINEEFANLTTVEHPFTLGLTHFMIVKGKINDKDSLNLFLDSGLAADSAGILLPKQTLDYIGIPIPPLKSNPENIGGLGGNFPMGTFYIDNCKIGSLEQENLQGLYGVFPAGLYFACEFIIDGIISHNFLKKYKWTIDFDLMKMYFTL